MTGKPAGARPNREGKPWRRWLKAAASRADRTCDDIRRGMIAGFERIWYG